MSTITVRDREYDLIENEYASVNILLLYLKLLNPKKAREYFEMGADLQELQSEIQRQYSEISDTATQANQEVAARFTLLLNGDRDLFPNSISHRDKAYGYLKTLVPSIPELTEEFSGIYLSEFLLAVAVPQSVRDKVEAEAKVKPKEVKPRRGSKKAIVADAPAITTGEDVAIATAVNDGKALTTEELVSAKNAGSFVTAEELAIAHPEALSANEADLREALRQQQANAVKVTASIVVSPDPEEELGL